MKQLILFILTGFSIAVASEMAEPYRSINELPFDEHGWFGNAHQLESLLIEKQPKTVIEVGSWLGLSTRFIASHMGEDAILYAIDTWKGSANEAVHMQDPRLPHLYQLFLSNIKHAQLTHKIIPLRMESIEAANALNIKADLIYLDASHDTQSVIDDILHWYPHLANQGVMCGDDWLWESVREAVFHCAYVLNKRIYYDNNFWRFE